MSRTWPDMARLENEETAAPVIALRRCTETVWKRSHEGNSYHAEWVTEQCTRRGPDGRCWQHPEESPD